MTENDEKIAEELATKYTYPTWPKKSEWNRPERYSTLMYYEIAGVVSDAYAEGFLAGIAHQKKKTEGLESLLTAIRYAMSADGIKDETFYLNLKSAIDQTLREYETSK